MKPERMLNYFLIVLSLFPAWPSNACVCSDFEMLPEVSEKHLDESSYQLFTGKIIGIETLTEPLYPDTTGLSDYQKTQSRSFQLITISVIRSYGSQITTDTIRIATGMGVPDCGITFFKKKKKYLFTVGTKEANKAYFWTSICLPNRELKHAKSEIEFIENNR
ncbi:MAG: hypothetical protein KDD41_09100 [Flavobacteriales bacterium]|nr:hypothetical protein [Flavobacteriales bacterium]